MSKPKGPPKIQLNTRILDETWENLRLEAPNKVAVQTHARILLELLYGPDDRCEHCGRGVEGHTVHKLRGCLVEVSKKYAKNL